MEFKSRVIESQQNRLLSLGFTGIREVEMTPEAMRAYQAMRQAGRLKIRVSMGLDVTVGDWNRMDEILAPWGVGPGFGDEWLRLDSVSEFAVDGAGPLAWTREPHASLYGRESGKAAGSRRPWRTARLASSRGAARDTERTTSIAG